MFGMKTVYLNSSGSIKVPEGVGCVGLSLKNCYT